MTTLSPEQLSRLAATTLDPCPECGSDDVSIIDYSDNLHECEACGTQWDSTTIYPPEQRLSAAQLSTLALGEQRAPAEVDTLRDESCPVCGSVDYRGSTCSACGYAKSPVIFHDPNVEKAKSTDLRTPTAPVDLACDSCGAVYPAHSGGVTASRKVADTIPSPPPLPGQEGTEEPVTADPEEAPTTTNNPAAPSSEHERGDVCPSCGQGTLLPKDEVDGVEAEEVEGFDSEGDPVEDVEEDVEEPGEGGEDADSEIPDVEDEEGDEDTEDEGDEDAEEEFDEDDSEDEDSEDDLSEDEDDPEEGVRSPGKKSRTSQKEQSMTTRQPQRRQASSQRRTAVKDCVWEYLGDDDGGNLHWWECKTHGKEEAGGPPGEPPYFNCEKYYEEYNAANPYTGSKGQNMNQSKANPAGQQRRRMHATLKAQNDKIDAQSRLIRRQAASLAIMAQETHKMRQAVLSLATQAGNRSVVASLDPRRANAAENNDDVALTDETAAAPKAKTDLESEQTSATDSVTPDATTDVESDTVALDTKPLNELVDVTEEHNDTGETTGTTTDHTGPAKTAPEANDIADSGWKTSSAQQGERTWAAMHLAKMRKGAGLTEEEPTLLAQRLAADESISMESMETEIRTLKALAARQEAAAPSDDQRRHLVPRSASQAPSLAGGRTASASSDDVSLDDTIM